LFFEQLEELYGKKTCKKVQKTFKKVLTRESGCDIISKLSERGGGERGSRKKLKKVLKNLLTNGSVCDITYGLPMRRIAKAH